MNKLKKALRLIGLTLLIILAMCGVGFLGALFPTNRDQQTKPINVERKDEDRDENDSGGVKE
jgi:hypothetical protein